MEMKNGKQDPLQMLDDIQRMEAPPFLMTRIQERIKQGDLQTINLNRAAVFALGFALLLALNIWVVFSSGVGQEIAPQLVESMNLHSNNELYPSL